MTTHTGVYSLELACPRDTMNLTVRLVAVCLSFAVALAWVPTGTPRFASCRRPDCSDLHVVDSPPTSETETATRRGWIRNVLSTFSSTSAALVVTTAASSSASTTSFLVSALDMDAFASQQLSKTDGFKADRGGGGDPSRSAMSDDEALCRFGQPSQSKGDACVRAGISTAPARKGGVNAYGQVDRGDYKRCKKNFELINGKWEDEWICQ